MKIKSLERVILKGIIYHDMKKTKLLGITSLLLAFGLSGCSLFGGEATVNEDWTRSATQHWKEDSNGNIVGTKEEHTYVESEGDGNKHVPVAATCTADGKKVEVCSVCGRYSDSVVTKLGHDLIDLDDGTSGLDLCEKGGKLHKICNRPGCTYEINEDIAARGHSYNPAVETGKTGVTKVSCKNSGCTAVSYIFDVSKATGWNKADTKWNAKTTTSDNNQVEASWDVTGVVEDGKYAIEFEAKTTSAGHTERYFYNQYETDSGDNADKSSEAPFRYFFKVNDGAAINPDTTETWGDLGYNTDTFVSKRIVSTVDISGATKFSTFHGDIGYSMIVSKVTLVKIG